ncbi:MAG: hypothetical protein A3B68_02260 [Candidatus Melainabacteria bacterium RIFCSPHIGHO2_02_FULL_34_12]|nr:MAG: hypothetical protein A3B68_02260 [Candidatus Melainabacteria bacterium RIFCSPHIGHO2_02_FULL_34_12]
MKYNLIKIMITKEDEYKAEVCKIGGLALIAPFGKEMLNVPYIELFNIQSSHLLYMIFTLLLACIGINMIFKGTEILREKRN